MIVLVRKLILLEHGRARPLAAAVLMALGLLVTLLIAGLRGHDLAVRRLDTRRGDVPASISATRQ